MQQQLLLILLPSATVQQSVSYRELDFFQGRQCFETTASVQRLLNNPDDPIRISLPNVISWTSARSLTAVGAILLKEQLGYDVTVLDYESDETYGLLASGDTARLPVLPLALHSTSY
eukprot:6201167-Pleurochrysis_carterae.AAC.2